MLVTAPIVLLGGDWKAREGDIITVSAQVRATLLHSGTARDA